MNGSASRINSFIILLMMILACRSAEASPLCIDVDESTMFAGDTLTVEGKRYYKGTLYTSNFNEFKGVFDSNFEGVLTVSKYGQPDNKTLIYQDFLFHNRNYCFATVYKPGKRYEEYNNRYLLRYYDFDKEKWVTNNLAYDRNSVSERDDVADTEGRIVIWILHYVIYPLLLWYALFKLLSIIKLPKKIKQPLNLSLLALCLIAAILMPDNLLFGLFVPATVFLIVYAFSFLAKTPKGRTAMKIASAVAFFALIGYQYLCLDETVLLSDGTKVAIRWQRGTDPVKRMVVRNLAKSLRKVPDTDAFVAKHRLRNYEAAILIGEYMGWLKAMRPNELMDQVSYHDAKRIVGQLHALTNNPMFQIPSARILACAYNHSNIEDYRSEIPEWTRDETETGRVSLTGDLVRDLAYAKTVEVANGKIQTTDKPKCNSIGIEMRIGYDNPHSSSPVTIKMHLQDDQSGQYPREAILVSIDGEKVVTPDWDEAYETIIASSNRDRKYEVRVIDASGRESAHTLEIKADTEPYIFYPAR